MSVKDQKLLTSLYVTYIEEILAPSKEYHKYKDIYCKLRDKLEPTLNDYDKGQLEEICCSIFDLEESMHKQAFIKRLCNGD